MGQHFLDNDIQYKTLMFQNLKQKSPEKDGGRNHDKSPRTRAKTTNQRRITASPANQKPEQQQANVQPRKQRYKKTPRNGFMGDGGAKEGKNLKKTCS